MSQQVKIVSWNVNGIRAIMGKNYLGKKSTVAGTANALDYMIAVERPDIICLQEIRCSGTVLWHSDEYPYVYQNHCQTKKGYSGTLVASKLSPYSYFHDTDGRIMILEFEKFFLLNIYSPNTMSGPDRMDYRIHIWEPALRSYVAHLQTTGKRIIISGDLNVIPTDDDMSVVQPICGSSPMERAAFFELLRQHNLVDTFRQVNIGRNGYSWGHGFQQVRLDFFLLSQDWAENILNADVLNYYGSDHRPILLDLRI